MYEFDHTIRAKSEKASIALQKVIGDNPEHFRQIGLTMVPDVSITVPRVKSKEKFTFESSTLFADAHQYILENPGIRATDLMHHEDKSWEDQKRDLATLVILSRNLYLDDNLTSLEGMANLYKRVNKNILWRLKTEFGQNRSMPSRAEFAARIFDLMERSCIILEAKGTNDFKRKTGETYLKPAEIRIVLLSGGLSGEKISNEDIVKSEKKININRERSMGETLIFRNLLL